MTFPAKDRRATIYFQTQAELDQAKDKAQKWNERQEERRALPFSAYIRWLIRHHEAEKAND